MQNGFIRPYVGTIFETTVKRLGTAFALLLAGYAGVGYAAESLISDPDFGGGVREYNFVSRDAVWRAIKTQADGKIVLAGYINGFKADGCGGSCPATRGFALQRLNPDGSLDRTFAPGSPTPGTLAFGVGTDQWENAGTTTGLTLAIDSDGNYVVGGTLEGSDYQLAFARIKPDGTRDTTLNPQGTLPGTFLKNLTAGREVLYAMTIDSQGRYLIGGKINENGLPKAFVGRLLPTGALDSTFNPSGPQPGLMSFFVPATFTWLRAEPTDSATITALALDASGRIVFSGITAHDLNNDGGGSDPGATSPIFGGAFMGRLNSDGAFDTSFAVGGAAPGIKILTPSDGAVQFRDVGRIAIDSQGRILYGIAKYSAPFSLNKAFGVYRLNVDGSIDSSFGGQVENSNGATFIVPNATTLGELFGLEAIGGDQVLVVGAAFYKNGAEQRTYVAQLSTSGQIVASFGNTGPDSAPGFRVINHQGLPNAASRSFFLSMTGSSTLSNGKLFVVLPLPNQNSVPYRAVHAVNSNTGADEPAFGNSGRAVLSGIDNESEHPIKVVQSASGGMYVIGETKKAVGTGGYSFWLARTDATGALDKSWQPGGMQPGVLRWSGRDAFGLFLISNVKELPDGKLLIAGITKDAVSKGNYTILRLMPDGSTDTSYGNGVNYPGTFFYQGTGIEGDFATAFDSSGRAVIAGRVQVGSIARVLVFRVTADGKIDNTFGDGVNPYVIETFGDNTASSIPVKVMFGPDGKIILVGRSAYPGAARYLSDGTLDSAFNPNGTRPGSVAYPSLGNLAIQDAIIDQSGRLVLVAGSPDLSDALLLRILSNGTLDPGFGKVGKASGALCCYFQRVVEASNGSLYAMTGGTLQRPSGSNPTSGSSPGVVKFTASGAVDTGFSPGLLTDNQASDSFVAYDLLADSQSRLLILATSKSKNTLLYRFVKSGIAAPGSPIIEKVVAGNGSAIVVFRAPASDGGGAITGYTVRTTSSVGTDLNAGSTALSHVITGLVNGSSYTFTVGAVNAAGSSPSSSASIAASPSASVSVQIVTGWSLLGNSGNAPIDVASTFGDPATVLTVWKWMPDTSVWAFYTPAFGTAALNDHAAAKGYQILSSIQGGEGFWVNAKTGFSATLSTGTPLASGSFASGLRTGWNLVATGDDADPRGFNNRISASAPSQGSVAALALNTLWAWHSTQSAWYFYAPSLDNTNGLATYSASKGYLDFGTRTLAPWTGFWVNKP